MNGPEKLKQREGKKKKKRKSPIKPLPTPGPSHLPSLRGPPVRPQFACDDPAASPMPGSSRAGRVTRTRHLGELSSRSSKTPRIANGNTCMQGTDSLHAVSEPGGRALRELSSTHCLLALPRGKLEMCSSGQRERALTAFLFCLVWCLTVFDVLS